MRIAILLVLGVLAYLVWVLYTRRELRRVLESSDNPLVFLTRRERRRWARSQLLIHDQERLNRFINQPPPYPEIYP